jgi:hypothetical protein
MEMVCEAYAGAVALRLVSVSTNVPLNAPTEAGAKLTDSVQEVPAASDPGADESLPATGQAPEAFAFREKFDPILGFWPEDGTGNVKTALPTFSTVTVCGLSVLIEPTAALAKVKMGGSAKSVMYTELFPEFAE